MSRPRTITNIMASKEKLELSAAQAAAVPVAFEFHLQGVPDFAACWNIAIILEDTRWY